MTANQFRAALARLELSQLGAARLFGTGERTPRRWASGDAAVPPQVAILLRLLVAGKISMKDIEAAHDR